MARSRTPATKPTTVVFVRHGQTPSTGKVLPGRAPGLHLAESGRAQADAVAGHLATLPRIDAVYVSPLERARETAAPIAKVRALRARTDRLLLECDFGEWTGRSLKDLVKLPEWKAVQRHPTGFRFPGGESFAEMQGRMREATARYRALHPGGTIVAVSHADPIKAAVADALGAQLDQFQRIVISTCSVTVIVYSDEGATVLTVNHTGSLAGLAPS